MKPLASENLFSLIGGDAYSCAHTAWGVAAGLAIFGGPLGVAAGLGVFMVGTVGCVEYYR